MIPARGGKASRAITQIAAPPLRSINIFDPISNLPKGDYPEARNMLIRPSGPETRPYLQADTFYDNNRGVMSEEGYDCVWQQDGKRFGIYTSGVNIFYQKLDLSDSTMSILNFSAGTTFSALVPAGDRVFAFRPDATPYVLEYDDVGDVLTARLAGFEDTYVDTISVGSGTLEGDYIYGVELVRKDGEAVIASGGINRTDSVTGSVRVWTITGYGPIVSAPLHATDSNWTHIRLWRTKRLDEDPDSGIIRGRRDILYLIQEIEEASWGGSFVADNYVDDQLPLTTLGAQEATIGAFELSRLPPANVAHFHDDKLFFATTDLDEDNGQRVYESKPLFRYAESYSPLDSLPCQETDSGYIQGIFTQGSDLVISRYSEIGRIPAGDLTNGYYKTDRGRGFGKRRLGAVVGVGVFACSGAGDIYRLGPDLTWQPMVPGSQTRLRGAFEDSDIVRFSQWDGNILVHGLESTATGLVYVLNVNDGAGWTDMLIKNSLGNPTNVAAMWSDPHGERTLFVVSESTHAFATSLETGDQPWARPGYNNRDQIYNSLGGPAFVQTDFSLTFPPGQDAQGRSIFQHLYFSFIAANYNDDFEVTCIGPDRDTEIGSGTASPTFESSDTNQDKDRFLTFTFQPDEPVYGSRVAYRITTTGPFRLTSAMTECILDSVQERDYRPDLIPTEVAAIDPLRDRSHWVTRGNPTYDIIARQDTTEVP